MLDGQVDGPNPGGLTGCWRRGRPRGRRVIGPEVGALDTGGSTGRWRRGRPRGLLGGPGRMAGAEELGKVLGEQAEGEVEEVADGCELGREV